MDAAANQVRTLTWLRRNIPSEARLTLTDLSSAYGVLSLMGPKTRDILAELTPEALSKEAFPFLTMKEIEVGYGLALAFRVTYVGELGWELHVPVEFMGPLFDQIEQAGSKHGLKLAGYHALDSLRSEKGYRHWGHDISPAETPYEAGLGFAVTLDKRGGFIGRDALAAQKGRVPGKRLVHVLMRHPEPFLHHDEPIYRDGILVGRITSASEGYLLGAAVGMGYVSHPEGVSADYISSGAYEVEIACERYPADLSLRPFYDPASARVRL